MVSMMGWAMYGNGHQLNLPYDGRTVSTDRKERKVLRGGDWFVQPSDVSVFTRLALEPQVRGLMDGGVGFRCAMGI